MRSDGPHRSLSELGQLIRAAFGEGGLAEFDAAADPAAWAHARAGLCVPVPASGPRLISIHDDAVLGAARAYGLDSMQHRNAGALVGVRLRALIEATTGGDMVLVHGGPPLSPVQRTVDMASLPVECSWCCEGRIAQTVLPTGMELPALRDRLLRTDGIARVLVGRALELWDGDPAAGVVAVAEPDRSFEDHRADCGDRVDTARLQGVLMAWGSQRGRPWPPRLHDYRIAPSIAKRLGVDWIDPWDSPFEL
jgi:hypothetical protein